MPAKRKASTKSQPAAPVPTVNTGGPGTLFQRQSPEDLEFREFQELVGNAYTSRQQFFQNLLDPRRDIRKECGWPDYPSPEQYAEVFRRNPYAQRACEVMAKEAFQGGLRVFETDENEDEETEFDSRVKDLNGKVRPGVSWLEDEENAGLQDILTRAAIQAAVNQFSVILIGTNDGLSLREPAAGVIERFSMPSPKKKDQPDGGEAKGDDGVTGEAPTSNSPPSGFYSLTVNREVAETQVLVTDETTGQPVKAKGKREVQYLSVFGEVNARVVQWETNKTSPRYNQPVVYGLTYNSYWDNTQWTTGQPTYTEEVHWTRVVHVPGPNVGSGMDTLSRSVMEPILNDLLNLDKIRGAFGEGYWKSAFTGLSLETHPQLGTSVKVNRADIKNQLENYDNSLTRTLFLMGMSAKTIAPVVSDPTPFVERSVEAICIKLGIPKRIFMGSERGELSSSQDEGDWDDKLQAYQTTYLKLKLVAALVDRLILLGCVPEPETGRYRVKFGDLDALTLKEKADGALTMTQAMGQALQLGVIPKLFSAHDYLVHICRFLPEDVEQFLENAEAEQAEFDQENAALADEHGLVPQLPGFEQEEQAPVTGQPGGFPQDDGDEEFTENAFCKTGKGGGVDPSCSPGQGDKHTQKQVAKLRKKGMEIVDNPYLSKDFQVEEEPPQAEDKSPHEMTLSEFLKQNPGDDDFARARHKMAVEEILEFKGTVSQDVLKDYPDLVKKYGGSK